MPYFIWKHGILEVVDEPSRDGTLQAPRISLRLSWAEGDGFETALENTRKFAAALDTLLYAGGDPGDR